MQLQQQFTTLHWIHAHKCGH